MSNLDKLQQLNTNTPRETCVYSLDGMVVKRPAHPTQDTIRNTNWINKQRFAQHIQEFLKTKDNKFYFIPKMLEVSTTGIFAIEEKVPGHPITSAYAETLTPADFDIIYRGIAHFINDMATYRQPKNQSEYIDMPNEETHNGKLTIAYIVNHMKKYLSNSEIETIKKAKALFDDLALNDASIVFSHGDMNEHNIFYDPTKKIVSIIDVADAKYENAYEMFNANFARLGWLDIDRLVAEFNALPHKTPIRTETNPVVISLRHALQNFRWCACEILHTPKQVSKIRLKMLKDEVATLANAYAKAKMSLASSQLAKTQATTTQTTEQTILARTTQHQH